MVKSCLKENVNLVSTEWSKISVVNQGIPHTNPDFMDRHANMKAEAETGWTEEVLRVVFCELEKIWSLIFLISKVNNGSRSFKVTYDVFILDIR